MPVNITLKNIPDALYQSLKLSAERNRRSLNMEAITVLEQSLAPKQAISVEECIARIRKIHETMKPIRVTDADIDAFKRKGRK